MLLALLFGLLCGIALGLTGGGGSILAVPMLVYGLGLPFHQAITISLLVVGLTALSGFLPRIKAGELELQAGLLLGGAGIIAAPLGGMISNTLSSPLLMFLFAVLMVIVGVWTLFKATLMTPTPDSDKTTSCQYLPDGRLNLTLKCRLVIIIAGLLTGILTGLFGVGGGFLVVPALLFAAKMPIKKAITTSLLIIFLISVTSFGFHIQHTAVNWPVSILFIMGGMSGMGAALLIKNRLNNQKLQTIFAALVTILGIAMLIRNL